ncbi:MAG TPA: asparagine synthetase B, partial [Chitinophagaceae bacterium]|nr:asparagine synthetase B [Chitinophagaceae bacterium]
MCGIAGAINFQLDIPLLTKDLYHRGPDEQNSFTDDNLILHHHRLSILDISGGAQPMHYEHFTIIFNGEIYNHLEVRKKLNLNCRTHSDTETILQAYEKLGAECLHEFDGMFALAIYDKQKKQLFLARDRAGKKPLYYYQAKDQFVFCSELLALKYQLPLLINENNIFQFIRLGYFYKTATPYQNVNELQAGSYATIDLLHPIPQVFKWWNIHQFYEKPVNDDFETAMQKTEHYLHEAVR